MHDPVSQAVIKRVVDGDHSNEAIAQLLIVMLHCQQSTTEKTQEIIQKIDQLQLNYNNCPGRQSQTKSLPNSPTSATPKVHWSVLLKYGLWVLLGFLAILAATLGISLPFLT